MDFHEMVRQLREAGEDGPPETIYDELSSAYTLLVEGSASKVAELQSEIENRETEISRLKGQNFDLLMASGVSRDSDDENDETENNQESLTGIDALF